MMMLAVLLVLVASASSPVCAAPPEQPGAVLYRRYCGACHGPTGRGDGAVAPALGERPTDLTQLAKRSGGTFPSGQVVDVIDGTRSIRAHGVSEMPVWGEVFQAQPRWSVQRHIDARGTIALIADYLRTIQDH